VRGVGSIKQQPETVPQHRSVDLDTYGLRSPLKDSVFEHGLACTGGILWRHVKGNGDSSGPRKWLERIKLRPGGQCAQSSLEASPKSWAPISEHRARVR
jgi:hypothetical protein